MNAKCVGCGLVWNIAIDQRIPATGYTCPHCESKMRAGDTLEEIQARAKRAKNRKEQKT